MKDLFLFIFKIMHDLFEVSQSLFFLQEYLEDRASEKNRPWCKPTMSREQQQQNQRRPQSDQDRSSRYAYS